jgi:ribonuclease E
VPRILLLNVEDPEEQRALLLEDGRPSLYWVERADEVSLVGNVYRGRVVHLEPAIGAAFVDIGQERPGFLHVDDIMPGFEPGKSVMPPFVERLPPGEQNDVATLLARGQELAVQVTRDPILQKGPSLTTHISLAARTAVLMPSLGRIGVSRRVMDEAVRDRVRDFIEGLGLPDGLGVVVRTAGAEADPDELGQDVQDLCRDLDLVRAAFRKERAPALLRQEGDFVTRALRDLLVRRVEGAERVTEVHVDDECAADRADRALAAATERPDVFVHDSPVPLFHAHEVESHVRKLHGTRVQLSGGASLVIQGTEALWAIDVNSGRMRRGTNLEETALSTGLLAAVEAARQIRLRDLGGLIVVDFIDCREPGHRRQVEDAFRDELAKDPARLRMAPMSEFMVAEITRRRLRRGPAYSGSTVCDDCGGRGRIVRPAPAALAALRDVRALLAGGAREVLVQHGRGLAEELASRAEALERLSSEYGVPIRVSRQNGLPATAFRVTRVKSR